MIGEYVEMMRVALRPHSNVNDEQLGLRCIGILGAAEAMAGETRAGRATAEEAVTALSAMIVGSVA